MCKANSLGCVRQIRVRLQFTGANSTIFWPPPPVAFGCAVGRGGSDDSAVNGSLPDSQIRHVARFRHAQSVAGTCARAAVSHQSVFRRARPCSGQIRNAALGGSGWRSCPAGRPPVWFLTHSLVSDQTEIHCRRNVRPAAPTPRPAPSQKKSVFNPDTPNSNQTRQIQVYEQFREQALGSDRLTWGRGLSVLLSRGMAAWMQYRAKAEALAHHEVALAPLAPSGFVPSASAASPNMPQRTPQAEYVFVLAALVMGWLTSPGTVSGTGNSGSSEVRHG